MLAEERTLRKFLAPLKDTYRSYENEQRKFSVEKEASRLITALVRAVREDERGNWMEAARNSHSFHRCNVHNPCELCRLMNPTAIRAKK